MQAVCKKMCPEQTDFLDSTVCQLNCSCGGLEEFHTEEKVSRSRCALSEENHKSDPKFVPTVELKLQRS